jgi:pimeloyl-ACP methyl ester carboxylesterase
MRNPEAAPDEDPAVRRAAALDRLTFRPDVATVAGTESQLQQMPDAPPTDTAAAARLRDQAATAMRQGRTGEALRRLYQAISLLRHGQWSSDAFPASLALETAPVVDGGQPLLVTVSGAWPEVVPSPEVTFHLRLAQSRPNGAVVRDLGVQNVTAHDLVAQPQRYWISLQGVAPGGYRLQNEVAVGGRPVGTVRAPLSVVNGLYARAAAVEAALARVPGHEDAKATIRYPFSLARELAVGKREILAYDFAANVDRSEAMLAALQAGKDPIVRATGDLKRAYYFADADTIVPYRLYVPKVWKPGMRLPLVVFLHGANLDDDDTMERANGLFPRLAEQRNIILLAPLGYRMNSGYGAFGPSGDADPFGGLLNLDDPRRAALSEQDVLNVTDIVAREYDVDPRRIYLSGNSMGGAGTWHIGAKYPERWAAIGPAAFGVRDPKFDFGRLRNMPIIAVAGEFDFMRNGVEETVAKARAAGLKPTYVMAPRGTHGTGIEIAMPQVLDFFAKHPRK